MLYMLPGLAIIRQPPINHPQIKAPLSQEPQLLPISCSVPRYSDRDTPASQSVTATVQQSNQDISWGQHTLHHLEVQLPLDG